MNPMFLFFSARPARRRRSTRGHSWEFHPWETQPSPSNAPIAGRPSACRPRARVIEITARIACGAGTWTTGRATGPRTATGRWNPWPLRYGPMASGPWCTAASPAGPSGSTAWPATTARSPCSRWPCARWPCRRSRWTKSRSGRHADSDINTQLRPPNEHEEAVPMTKPEWRNPNQTRMPNQRIRP